ncbi:MAG: tRNA (N(6)-L-threonylcarbamoyladenosine(37)-C(2))-methylthiotransferase MtaB [Eubacterium sp.]
MKVAFLTLGCKVNFYETEKMEADFEAKQIKVVPFKEKADVYIVNTCTVTNIADRKSRQMLHRAKRLNPDSIVVAVGCYAESGKEQLEKDESIDVVFANRDKESIASQVLAYLSEHRPDWKIEENKKENTLREHLHDSNPMEERTRKYIKIQDGCNQFCTYCLIPYVRGGGELKSREEEAVIAEIKQYAKQGFKEVVLTGIHLSSYGVDRSPYKQFVKLKGQPLVELMKKIDKVEGIERIRLGSLEPRIICEEFLNELQKVTKFCPHFHLSLQSGCDATLKRMNRHYTVAEYLEKCEQIRKVYEHPAITTDVIVGFPGETLEDFETTRAFVKEAKLADIHVFPYSERTGTRAAKMSDPVDAQEKHRRSEILIQDVKQLNQDYQQYFVGKEVTVLFEEIQKVGENEYLTGHNERYVRFGVRADTTEYEENQMVSFVAEKENIF